MHFARARHVKMGASGQKGGLLGLAQMHKEVPARRVWHSIVLKHGDLRTRLYYPNDPRPERIKFPRPPTKAPAKRKVSKKARKSNINGMLSSD